jgi:hypothetical protein
MLDCRDEPADKGEETAETKHLMKLRFSIRDLLWLTALCAVLVAWWMESRRYTELVEHHRIMVDYYKTHVTDRPVNHFWQPDSRAKSTAN